MGKTKEELTVVKAIELNLTNIECVKYYWPDLTDEQAEYILWEETCFPFSTEGMLTQLHNKFQSK